MRNCTLYTAVRSSIVLLLAVSMVTLTPFTLYENHCLAAGACDHGRAHYISVTLLLILTLSVLLLLLLSQTQETNAGTDKERRAIKKSTAVLRAKNAVRMTTHRLHAQKSGGFDGMFAGMHNIISYHKLSQLHQYLVFFVLLAVCAVDSGCVLVQLELQPGA
jgi:hypothetical protein